MKVRSRETQEAFQFSGDHSVWDMTKCWGADFVRISIFSPEGLLSIKNEAGEELEVMPSDYVLRDECGRFKVVPRHIFEQNYEAA